MHSPFFGADVVRYTKYHGMRISDVFVFEYCRYGCTVVNDDSNVFEAIDGDEGFILIVSHVQQSSMNDLVREWYIPPNSEFSRITSTSLKGAITKQGS